MLEIKNLYAKVSDKLILKGVDFSVNPGEIHAIMGPNGSGKSTLTSVLAGKEDYDIEQGQINFMGEDISEISPEERSWRGLFVAFQYPVEIPGVSNINFLKTALEEKYSYLGLPKLTAKDFLQKVKEKSALVKLKDSMTNRSVNEGFSGGEKKKNEIFQMAMLEPKLSILDETDSGLDIDALKIVSEGVNALRSQDSSTIIITHYQRLLNYIIPDYVHVMYDGKIVKSGDKTLAYTLEERGYDWIIDSVNS